jgi:hypothetical protein
MSAPSSAPHERALSASDYKAARSCLAKLFFRKNGYPDNREADPYAGLLADGAFMVKALAQAKYPQAVAINPDLSVASAARATAAALSEPHVVVANATLMNGRRWARVSLLDRQGDVVRLVDVRSKSFDSAAHAESTGSGGKGVFRAKRKPWPLVAAWVPLMEELAFKAACVSAALPQSHVVPYLALIDTSKVAGLDNVPSFFALERRERSLQAVFLGDETVLAQLDLITEVDCREEVALVSDVVTSNSKLFETHLESALETIIGSGVVRGSHCGHCEYLREGDPESGFNQCWGKLGAASPHVLELFSVGPLTTADGAPLVESMFQSGTASLLDVPTERLVTRDGIPGANNIRQLRQIERTRSGEPYVGPGLPGAINALKYPLHFIDFEACRLALPYHKEMRPYGVVAFQWSCHTVDEPGATPRHSEWLNAEDIWPNESFAESLRSQVGDHGSLLTWSQFESGTLSDIASELRSARRGRADLLAWLDAANGRIVDLEAWAKLHYYHPGMRGSTSIKVVLDALWRTTPSMRSRYQQLTGREAGKELDPYHALPAAPIAGEQRAVREGTAAIGAYQAMMYGPDRDVPGSKAAWSSLLRDYCGLDTLAMVLVFEHWQSLAMERGT